MPEILFAKVIASKLEQIIDEARSVVILISPYVQVDNRIADKLKYAAERGVSIVLLHRPRELKNEALQLFNELSNCETVPIRNLHTKCYLNDQSSVLMCSMNLYKYSEKNNWEMGVYFDFRNEEEITSYQKIYSEITAMLNLNLDDKESEKIMEALGRLFPIQYIDGYIIVDGKRYTKEEFKKIHQSLNVKTGYCIKCGSQIDYFPLHPYCLKCFKVWSKSKEYVHVEKHCHRCCSEVDSTINEPHCETCDGYYHFELGLYFADPGITSIN